ncbi:MAG TPA: DoxX family protein [Solirubrobacteraceae bacterium]|nr:DoxX family protein [Solirubrobacteraceae bacterium]
MPATLVSCLLAGLAAFAAIRKLSHRPEVVVTYTAVGVPEERLDALAVILLAGAAGLVAGLLWAPIGAAAAAGFVVYFLVAIAAHVRAGDLRNVPTPVVMELLAVAALILRLA